MPTNGLLLQCRTFLKGAQTNDYFKSYQLGFSFHNVKHFSKGQRWLTPYHLMVCFCNVEHFWKGHRWLLSPIPIEILLSWCKTFLKGTKIASLTHTQCRIFLKGARMTTLTHTDWSSFEQWGTFVKADTRKNDYTLTHSYWGSPSAVWNVPQGARMATLTHTHNDWASLSTMTNNISKWSRMSPSTDRGSSFTMWNIFQRVLNDYFNCNQEFHSHHGHFSRGWPRVAILTYWPCRNDSSRGPVQEWGRMPCQDL